MLLPLAAALVAVLCLHRPASAHSEPDSKISDHDGDWASWHMAEEHHLDNFDASSFFTLHDFSESDSWSPADVRRMYGLEHESNRQLPMEKREDVTRQVFAAFDANHDGHIDRKEFMDAYGSGVRLPDFGLGPGHHGDDEFEYEIHHFEKYHDENTRLEDLTHPEDIEHFAKHAAEDAELERIEKQNAQAVIDANIPDMFRRKSWRMEL